MKVKKGDFIELEYTGRIKSDNRIFDTTDEELMKKEGLGHLHMHGPIILCIGEKYIMPKLDKELEDKEIEKEYEINISSEEAFGKKEPKLVRIISMSLFKKQKMSPYPGLQINAEGYIGTVRSVTGGRVIVDFNHPLAGRDIFYTFKIIKKIEDAKSQAECVAKFNLFPDPRIYDLDLKENILIISSKIEFPEEVKKSFQDKIKELVPKIEKVEFILKKKEIKTGE